MQTETIEAIVTNHTLADRQTEMMCFIVDSTQYKRYLDLPSLKVGKRGVEPTRASIGVQLVDIRSTTTMSIEPRTTHEMKEAIVTNLTFADNV